MRHITLITTGGTIEKTYDEATGVLDNRRSVVQRMLRRLRLEETSISTLQLMSKDSLHMTEEDRRRIADVVAATLTGAPATTSGVVVLHGRPLGRALPRPAGAGGADRGDAPV
jgi:L-asparaginase